MSQTFPSALAPRSCAYRGRFAPSPTGPLHFGSLIAATGSYLQARQQRGEWLVRVDDIDPPREVAGAADDILRTLEGFGFEWDGQVQYQSHRIDRYLAAVQDLKREGLAYACSCSRKWIAEQADPQRPHVYPGLCRTKQHAEKADYSIRVLTEGSLVHFEDGHYGDQQLDLDRDCGDYVIRRADGLIAYQLATAIDDSEQGMSEVVRGTDLLDSTFRQIHLQRLLGLSVPRYLHLPIVTTTTGEKLSKQTGATPLQIRQAGTELYQALQFLGQQPPGELRGASVEEIWPWAIAHWNTRLLPAARQLCPVELAN